MLGLARAGRGTLDPLDDDIILARAEAVSARAGHTWTEGQRATTKALLVSPSSVVGIQGSVGTAKATTLRRVHAETARARGYTVRALAPTATAGDELARAIGGEPMTVVKMLTPSPATPCCDRKPKSGSSTKRPCSAPGTARRYSSRPMPRAHASSRSVT